MIAAFGPPSLDPCASDHAEYHLAAVNLTAAVNGLLLPWAPIARGGYAFTNWPYSKSPAWSAKVAAEAGAGCAIVALCAARPGAAWYHALKARADAACEVTGRLVFLSGDRTPDAPLMPPPSKKKKRLRKPGGAPFPSAILAFNLSWRRFFAAFDQLGRCEVPR